MSNKLNIQEQLEKELILESDLADGSLSKIFGPVKDNLKKFGTILKDSAALIGNDVAYLVKLTFGRLKSLRDLKQMKQKNETRRRKYINQIAKNSDELMNSWPDGKITSMMIAPGLFFTTEALSGVSTVTSPEFRQQVGEFGFDNLPFIGDWFDADDRDQSSFQDAIENCEPGDGECFARALGGLVAGSGGKNDKEGTLSKIALKINDMFLFAGHEVQGSVLEEGDDSSPTQLSTEAKKLLQSGVKKALDDQLKAQTQKWMEQEIKYCEKVTKEASQIISLNMTFAGTQSSETFFDTLDKMKEVGGDEMKDLDVDKVRSGFKEMGQKIKDDEKTMAELEKEFEENKTEKTDENLNKRLEELILSSFKGTFLQEMKDGLSEYYENVRKEITGGLTNDQRKVLAKDELAKSFLSKIDEFENKLKEALKKVEQS